MRKAILFALGLFAIGLSAAPLQAEVVTSPTKALRLLTEARVAAQKCGFLNPAARQELTGYAARAELTAVRREGTAAARQALKEGKRRGAAGCSAEKRDLVMAVLEGARKAARVARRTPRNPRREARRPERPRPLAGRVQRAAWRPTPGNRHGDDVRAYIALASAYYNALKCRNRPQAELLRMWHTVRRAHYDLLHAAGGAAVARAKREAARRGNARGCR